MDCKTGIGLENSIDSCLPGPGSGLGYIASERVFSLILMLNGNR